VKVVIAFRLWARRSERAPAGRLQVSLLSGRQKMFELEAAPTNVLVSGEVEPNELPSSPLGTYDLTFSDNAIRDLWIAVRWAKFKA
jgi:hypothetical protein